MRKWFCLHDYGCFFDTKAKKPNHNVWTCKKCGKKKEFKQGTYPYSSALNETFRALF